jgi:glutamate dehydrogenase/leucine dehydrogenase
MLSVEDLEVSVDHELVRIVRDPAAGLLAVIAIHSTTLGPSMGGVRRAGYATLDDAIADALRLSCAMTLKNSAAELPLGGGKSVIVDTGAEPSATMLDAFADAIEQLGGRYVAAEDIGTTPAHMDRIARRTAWVAGQSPGAGGNGDPSPATAATVFGSMLAGAAQRWGVADLADVRVGVLGAGKVGGGLAAAAASAGARLALADLDAERVASVARALGGQVVGVDELLSLPLDVLAPCARGGVLTAEIASSLDAEIVCGAANNILSSDLVADRLLERDILYVPDFIANAGGIIHVGGSFLGWDAAMIEARVSESVARCADVLAEARRRAVSPLRVAYERAAARLSGPLPEIVAGYRGETGQVSRPTDSTAC